MTEKKAALPREDVVKKLVDSHPSRLPPGQLGLKNVSIARAFPFVNYRIEGNFRGRKLSRISRFFSHLRKFSPRNSRHATPIMRPV